MEDLTAKLKTATGQRKEELEEQLGALRSEIKEKRTALRESYRSRIEFIDYEVGELGKWISEASDEDKSRFQEKIKDLRELAASLNDKANG
jgi:molybdopterin converting factor small subunit